MTETLIERLSIKGRHWIRTHAIDTEGFALCSKYITPETQNVELGVGNITCPDCIEIIKKCKSIPDADIKPEYENELFWKR